MVDAAAEGLMQAGMLLDALKQENRPASNEKPLALVVEDSPQAADLLRMHIESAGYRVEIARDGMEALEKAKRLLPNVITLDLLLPVKDGWAVMQELKKHPLCKSIPVIIVSIIDEKNLGFSLGAQTDGLGVATAFKVKDAPVGPAVFIVAHQNPIRRC